MTKEHHVIMVPGLNDQQFLQRHAMMLLPKLWTHFGVIGHVIAPHWEQGTSFQPKLKKITDLVKKLAAKGHVVSLFGVSAGGSAVLNAFSETQEIANGVVNATGRVRAGTNVTPSLDWAARNSPAFRESVLLFEHTNEPRLTSRDRKRIMTIRPTWDEIVPSSTVAVNGANNIVIPVREHMIAGIYASTIYVKNIIEFLEELR